MHNLAYFWHHIGCHLHADEYSLNFCFYLLAHTLKLVCHTFALYCMVIVLARTLTLVLATAVHKLKLALPLLSLTSYIENLKNDKSLLIQYETMI